MELCSTCIKRESCEKLCKEAEKYVNQDYVSQTEYITTSKPTQSIENLYDNDFVWNRVNIEKRKIKSLIIAMLKDGKSNSEIAYHLPCSTSYIRRIRRKWVKSKKKGVSK